MKVMWENVFQRFSNFISLKIQILLIHLRTDGKSTNVNVKPQ